MLFEDENLRGEKNEHLIPLLDSVVMQEEELFKI